MKLAVYQPYLKERGGSEKVVREIAERSSHDVTILTLLYDEESTFDSFQDIDVREVGGEDNPDSFFSQALNFGLKPAFKKLDLEEFDALVVSEAGFGSPITVRNNDLPTIAYCHTPLRAALPEFRETYRNGFHSLLRPFYPVMISSYNILESAGWRNFDFVFANSALTKSRILDKGITSEDKIEVLNPGVDVDGTESGKYGNYFFYPSRFEPYKRMELAIEAFEEADTDGFELVIAGSSADKDYVKKIKSRAGENVRIETDVPAERWEELYQNCYSVLFLAENEDWGIVPLEAMAHRKPVISVDEGGPREQIIDGETGFLVGTGAEEIARKIEAIASDREQVRTMGEKARDRSKDFSWQSFIERFDQKVDEVADG